MTVPFWEWHDPVAPPEGEEDKRLENAQKKIAMIKKVVPVLESMFQMIN